MKNPCKFRIGKYVVKNRLKIRFGKVLGSFVGGSGTVWGVSWALLGAFCRFFLRLKSICFATLVQHGLQEPVGADFGSVLGGSGKAWEGFWTFVIKFHLIFEPLNVSGTDLSEA